MKMVNVTPDVTHISYKLRNMRHTESLLFSAEQNDNLEYIKSALNKNRIKLIYTLKLYEI